jgi:hypothetical protein
MKIYLQPQYNRYFGDWTEHFGIYLHKNKQMHQNDHFIVMSSQTLLHVSAYQRHHHGAHMILTSYLYISVHYRKNNGISSKIVPVGIVTLWIQVGMANRCWKQWTVVENGPNCTAGSVRVAAVHR